MSDPGAGPSRDVERKFYRNGRPTCLVVMPLDSGPQSISIESELKKATLAAAPNEYYKPGLLSFQKLPKERLEHASEYHYSKIANYKKIPMDKLVELFSSGSKSGKLYIFPFDKNAPGGLGNAPVSTCILKAIQEDMPRILRDTCGDSDEETFEWMECRVTADMPGIRIKIMNNKGRKEQNKGTGEPQIKKVKIEADSNDSPGISSIKMIKKEKIEADSNDSPGISSIKKEEDGVKEGYTDALVLIMMDNEDE